MYKNFRSIRRRFTGHAKNNQPDCTRRERTWSCKLLRLWQWRQWRLNIHV